ncbi:hypothetical protein B4U56_08640 [Staphylococcus epidermidis]|nr:hypothetical protein B4U56_08640 [Staphylococcus epidermidis]OOD01282.1 hypothetical protein BWO96_08780 [Staphylococcus epidermidis]
MSVEFLFEIFYVGALNPN